MKFMLRVMTVPRLLLGLEGLAVAAAAVVLFADGDHSWWLFAALALAPDVAAVGYLAGPRVGALAYDLAHTEVWPVALGVAGLLGGWDTAIAVALVWLLHIGVDRAVGYGLKYASGSKDTHLQRV